MKGSLLAQLVERGTVNPEVVGSIPTWRANTFGFSGDILRIVTPESKSFCLFRGQSHVDPHMKSKSFWLLRDILSNCNTGEEVFLSFQRSVS